MAFKKKTYRKPYKKKYMKKKPWSKKGTASTAVANVSYSSGKNILADKFIGKLPWIKSYAFTAGTTDVIDWNWFIPSAGYDPEYAVSSAMQPLGWDQLALFYNHYRVIASKTTITCTHGSGNPMVVGIVNKDDVTTTYLATRDEALIDPGSFYRIISNERPTAKLVTHYNANKRYQKSQMSELTSLLSSNPAENWYHGFFKVNAGPGQTPASVVVQVRIDYTIEFSERKTLVKS